MNLTVEKINSLNVSKTGSCVRGQLKPEILFTKFENKERREPNVIILGKPGHGKMIRFGKEK